MCRGKVASSIVVVLGFVLIDCTPQAFARPAYGYNCVSCHSSVGFGHTTPRAIYDIVGTSQATIPAGAYGDPDRGEGPLPSYSASPGGDFRLEFQIKDPSTYDPPFTPTRWAIGIKRIYTTDPDYHAGNPDPLSWRDNQLVLQGAQPGPDYNTPDPAPIPAMSSDWSIYTLNSQQY